MAIGLGLGIGLTKAASGASFDFYVDSVNGDDGNDGTSLAQAFETLGAAETAVTSFGDGASVALVRGSSWREQFDVTVDDLTIGVVGTGDMPVIDGADIITGTWTQPDSGTYPNVWSISWSRSQAATTGSAHMGYWEEGARTTRQTSLANLQAGSNGDWHTTSLTGTTVTLSIRSAADPNSDGRTREATKRGYGINGHTQTAAGAPYTGLSFTGPIEMKRAVEHYNALSMGQGTASQFFLRDGNIHHSVSEGNQTDILATEYAPSTAPSVWAFYRATSSGFNPIGTRLLSLLPGGSNRVDGASAFYGHGGSGNIGSLTLNGCVSRGCDFANAAASLLTVNGGYCEDAPYRGINFGAADNQISHFLFHDTAQSAFNSSNAALYTAGGSATDATVTHSAVHILRGNGVSQFNTTQRHSYTNCAFVAAGSPMFGGGPDVNYCIHQGGRSYSNFLSTYTGDYNVFYFVGQANPQFQYNSIVYGTLADFQTASSQDANSVYLKHSDQSRGDANAFWLGVANDENDGPADGDWRINPSAKVYDGSGAAHTGTFADGTTPITDAGPQEYWNFNTRAVTSGVPVLPTLPSTISEMRDYVDDPEAWDFYP